MPIMSFRVALTGASRMLCLDYRLLPALRHLQNLSVTATTKQMTAGTTTSARAYLTTADGALTERGDISKPPTTGEAAVARIPVTTAAECTSALRPLRGPIVALAEGLPPLGEPRPAAPVPAATPDSISFGDCACAVRCLRCAAMVCCRRWFTTSRGLVGELMTVSFTLQEQHDTARHQQLDL